MRRRRAARIRRASLARLRAEVEAVARRDAGALPAALAGRRRRCRAAAPTGSRDVLVQLQGVPLPAAILEPAVLARRVTGYRPELLDALCAAGEVVWCGAGDGTARRPLLPRRRAAARARRRARSRRDGELATAAPSAWRRAARSSATSCWPPARARREAAATLWLLVWAGEVTNDAYAPVRAPRALRTLRPPRSAAGGRAACAAGRAPPRPPSPAAGLPAAPLFERADRGRAGTRAGRDPARAPRRRDACRRARRGGQRRLRRPLRRAVGAGADRAASGAATSSRAWVAPSSRCPARSSGCATCASAGREPEARGPRRRRSGPALRRGAAVAGAGRRPGVARPPAPTWCSSTAVRRCSSSAAAARCCRSSSPTIRPSPRRSRRWASRFHHRPAGGRAVRRCQVMGSDAEHRLIAAGFRPGPRRLTLG